MKLMIIDFGLFLMLILCCLSISSVARKQIIREEVNEAVSNSIRNTMELWRDNKGLSETELIDNFLDVLQLSLKSKSKYNVFFYEVDTKDGMMDVEVEAEFSYVNHKKDKVSIRKTMIYDEKMQ